MDGKQYTVQQLIEELKKYESTLPVLVSGYEGGLESHIAVSQQLAVNETYDYGGDYDYYDRWDDGESKYPRDRAIKVVTIERKG